MKTIFPNLDCMTNEWTGGQVLILASCPCMGKSSLSVSLCVDAAKQDIPVAYFSTEMTERQLMNRIKICHLGIPVKSFTKDLINGTYNQLPIFIDDSPWLSVEEFSQKAKDLVKNEGVRLIIINSANSMRFAYINANGYSTRKHVCQGIYKTAHELDVPIVQVQIIGKLFPPRTDEEMNTMRPTDNNMQQEDVKMLKEAEAESIVLLHRPEYYHRMIVDGKPTEGKAELFVYKHRKYEGERYSLDFDKECMRFSSSTAKM